MDKKEGREVSGIRVSERVYAGLLTLAAARDAARTAYESFDEKTDKDLPPSERVEIDLMAKRLLMNSAKARGEYNNALDAVLKVPEPITEPRDYIWGEPAEPRGNYRVFCGEYNQGNEELITVNCWACDELQAADYLNRQLSGVKGGWTLKVEEANWK